MYFKYVILSIFISSSLIAQDFRSSNWGDSEQMVRKVEKSKFLKKLDNILGYNDEISNLSCYLYYFFVDEKLVKAGYAFHQIHKNNNLYIGDYDKLKKLLFEKYGNPNKDVRQWLGNKSYYDRYPGRLGNAISVGKLQIYSSWENKDTQIVLNLSGDNGRPSLLLMYSSKKHSDLIDEAAKKKSNSKL